MLFKVRTKTQLIVLASMLFFFGAVVAQADEAVVAGPSNDDLTKLNTELTSKISALENLVKGLEQRLSGAEKNASDAKAQAASYVAAPAPSAAAVEGGAFKVGSGDINISGFVDTSYNWNFRHPTGALNGTTHTNSNSAVRAFDRNGNSFDLNNLQFNFDRPAPENGGVGFHTELMYGTDAQVMDSTGFDTNDEFAIQEAHLKIKIPIGSGLTVLAGKYATLMGAEVIENLSNWNSSRSLLFNNSIPFTHTGVRGLYNLFDGKVTTALGFVNGWDLALDNNNVKDLETLIGWIPSNNFSTSLGLMWGSQQFEDRDNGRGVLDWIATWTPFPDSHPGFKLMTNFDYGWEEDISPARTREDGLEDWAGYALYGKYDLYDWLTLAARWEQFWNDQGSRVGTTEGTNLWEMTYTADFKVYQNLLTRLEYRYDHSSKKTSFDSGTSDSQATLGLSLIYSF